MIYLTHPDHGAHHVYSEGEAIEAEKRGWSRAKWPPEPGKKVEAPAAAPAASEAPAVPVKKPGRPKKSA